MIVVQDEREILALLYEYDDVFPHNREKISDYSAWAEKLARHGVVVILPGEKETAGMAAFYCNDMETHTGYISLFGLKESYRGRGCADRFLKEILSYMQIKGMERAELEVDTDNPRAKRFYSKEGFAEKKVSLSVSIMERAILNDGM